MLKLLLQITLGVFLGGLASQLTVDAWRSHLESIAKQAAEKLRAEQESAHLKQGERIRALLLQGRRGNKPDTTEPPAGFVPDDAQEEILKEE